MGIEKTIMDLIVLIVAAGMVVSTTCADRIRDVNSISNFNISEMQQCFWGEWKITEKQYGGVGWQECDDDKQDVRIQVFSDRIICDGKETKVLNYYNEFLAIGDENVSYPSALLTLESEFPGNYCFKLDPSYDFTEIDVEKTPFFSYMALQSDTKMIFIAGRAAWRAEKVGEVEVEEESSLYPSSSNSMCYGTWEVLGKNKENEDKKGAEFSGITFTTSEEAGSFSSCKMLNVKDEKICKIVEQMETENNTFIGCYEFSDNYYWDVMIIQDAMTVLLIKGDDIYWARRRSDPVEDGIYHEYF